MTASTHNNALSKKNIDDIFVSLIPNFERASSGLLAKLNKLHIDKYVVINECYIHLTKHMKEVHSQGDVEKICYNWIRSNTQWFNSQINKQERVNRIYEINNNISISDEDDDEIEDKLEIEKWFTERQILLDLYRQQETDLLKQIVFDKFFIEGFRTSRALGNHLGINKDYANLYIKQMKADIREFVANYK